MDDDAIIAVSFLVGGAIGRWWAITLAIPAGYAGASSVDFEGFSEMGEGVLIGAVAAITITVGVVLRRGLAWVLSGRS